MIDAKNNNIEITQGDTGTLTWTLKKKDGTAYDMTNVSKIVMSVSQSTRNTTPLFTKEVTSPSSNIINISLNTSDTSHRCSTYRYSITVYHNNNTKVITPIEDATFTIKGKA